MKFLIKGVVHRQDSEGGASTGVLITNELSKGIGSTLKFGLAFCGTVKDRVAWRVVRVRPRPLLHTSIQVRRVGGAGAGATIAAYCDVRLSPKSGGYSGHRALSEKRQQLTSGCCE